MGITLLLSAAFLIFLGIILRAFKLSFLIAGYNTAPKHEKEKYNEEALIKAVSNLLILSSLVLVLGYFITLYFENLGDTIYTWTWIAYVIAIFTGLIYINTSSSIKRKK